MADLQKWLRSVLLLRKRALEELISDTVGIYLFGLSALYAGHEIHPGAGVDLIPSDANDGYPPGRMRLRVSLELSRAEGQLDRLANFANDPKTGGAFSAGLSLVNRIESLVAADDDMKAIARDPYVSIAYEWVKATLPSAQAFAKRAVGAAIYPIASQEGECSGLVERLLDGLPPNEIGNSLSPVQVDTRSAILASWLISLDASQSNDASKKEDFARLNEKTLRGIEYIELQSEYFKKYPGISP
jgi:hypothetical protein